jgi:phage FluMu protein Com
MGQLTGLTLGGPYIGLIIVVIVVAITITLRLYTMKTGVMRAKCPKCAVVFDASHMFSGIHIGPLKQLKCPACGKINLMNAYTKDPVTWHPKETSPPAETSLSSEELEKKRIEESKYEKA